MPTIRDLGINFIPETRQAEHEGLFAAAKKKPQGCGKSQCPTAATGHKEPTNKKKAISRKAVEQLHAQMQQKMAHTDLTE